MLNPSIQGTDKQDKSQLIQRSDTLIIFPYIKSTKNSRRMCVGLIHRTLPPSFRVGWVEFRLVNGLKIWLCTIYLCTISDYL